ncbi:MAG: NAD-dependent epimerase/dehydratase family protein [Planctomycetes bacterium]|nr:NAD-dependent epimerase/dehydratase family protein [Planctomycetota bacterium]
MSKPKIVVTGGAGFIGSHVARLLSADFDVVVIDDLSGGTLANLEGVRHEFLRKNVCDLVPEDVSGAVAVVHLAAHVSVVRSVELPSFDAETNVIGTLKAIEACRDAGVGRLIFSSSCAVYGENPNVPISESEPANPLAPYALAKLTAERYLLLAKELYRIEPVIFRFFNVYGPNQDSSSPYSGVISKFSEKLSRKESVEIFGDGSQTRDFVSVHDVARIVAEAADPREDYLGAGPFNVCTGRETSIADLAAMLRELTGQPESLVSHKPARVGEILRSAGNPSRLEALGFKTKIDLRDGLRELIRRG